VYSKNRYDSNDKPLPSNKLYNISNSVAMKNNVKKKTTRGSHSLLSIIGRISVSNVYGTPRNCEYPSYLKMNRQMSIDYKYSFDYKP